MNKMTDSERIAVIETEVKNVQKSIDDHLVEQRNDFDKVFQKLDSLNGKFAGKWVEKISIGILIGIIVGVAVFIITRSVGG